MFVVFMVFMLSLSLSLSPRVSWSVIRCLCSLTAVEFFLALEAGRYIGR